MANRVADAGVEAGAILGPDGRPLTSSGEHVNGNGQKPLVVQQLEAIQRSFSLGGSTGYLNALQATALPAVVRARDPFSHHAWVFAAALAVANAKSQAAFGLYRETERQTESRAAAAKRAGRSWYGPKRGLGRRAVQRHLARSPAQRVLDAVLRSAAEPDLEHPLNEPLLRPLPNLSGRQLWQLTDIWLEVRGEVFWVLSDAEGNPVTPGDVPERIWPIGPDCFEPMRESQFTGPLVGWWFSPPPWSPWHRAGMRLALSLSDVVQFKFPNPLDPDRGMSRLTAAAQGIETDLMVQTHNRSLLANNAVPKVAVSYKGAMSVEERREWMAKWKDSHEGPHNSGRIALLTDGFELQQIALSPEDMQFLELRKLDREEVLAVMGVPPSVLGVTEFTNYATALGQDKTFWEKTVFPLLRLEEDTLDASVLYEESDNIFAMFDLSGVEALRVGTDDKVKTADLLCGERLHLPPKTAFALVGLDVPEYEGDETALVSALATPIGQTTAPAEPIPGEPGAPLAEPQPTVDASGRPLPPTGALADTALNGAQVQSALLIVQEVAAGRLPRESGVAMLVGFFNLSEAEAEAIMGTVGAGFKPEPEPAPPAPFGGQQQPNEPAPPTPPKEDDPVDRARLRLLAVCAARVGQAPAPSGAPAVHVRGSRREANARRWRAFVRLQLARESKLRRDYRGWVEQQRRLALGRFDASLRQAASRLKAPPSFDLLAILPDLAASAAAAKAAVRPTYAALLEDAVGFTLPELGVPVFDPGDARFLQFFNDRERVFADSISHTQFNRLRDTLADGQRLGESLAELRLRIGQVYDLAASSFKTLQVARTETSGFFNGVRDQMFGLQGFTKEDWVTAEDEEVRDTHQVYGRAGPKPRGFDYMTLTGGGAGTLRFPGDPQGPPGEVINCRCLKVPVE